MIDDDPMGLKPGMCAVCGKMDCQVHFMQAYEEWINMPPDEKAKTNIFAFAMDFFYRNRQ